MEEQWGGCWQEELGQRVREGWMLEAPGRAAGSEHEGPAGHVEPAKEGPYSLRLTSIFPV